MLLHIEKLNGLERRVTISLSMDKYNKEVNKKLIEAQKKLKLPGFRPGKVPLKMVDGMYGQSTREAVLNELATNKFFDDITENKIQLAGVQKLELLNNESTASEIKVSVIFDIYPDEIEIKDLSKLKIEKIITSVEKEDVENTIEMLRKQRTTYVYTDKVVKAKNKVIIDFEGTVDGETFKGGSAKNYSFIVGGGQMLPDFEAGIIGMKEKDEKNVPVTFPKDYFEKNLAGRTANFVITVVNVSEPNVPELDDNFIKSLGIEDGKLTSLKKEIKKNLTREVSFRAHAATKENTIKALLENNTIDLPNSLIHNEVHKLKHDAKNNLLKQGFTEDNLPELKDELFEENAKKRVGLGVLFNKLIEDNHLKATDEQIRKVVATYAENYENPSEYINWYLKDPKKVQEATAIALEDKVIDFILKKAETTEKKLNFQEIMNIKSN